MLTSAKSSTDSEQNVDTDGATFESKPKCKTADAVSDVPIPQTPPSPPRSPAVSGHAAPWTPPRSPQSPTVVLPQAALTPPRSPASGFAAAVPFALLRSAREGDDAARSEAPHSQAQEEQFQALQALPEAELGAAANESQGQPICRERLGEEGRQGVATRS